MSEDDRIFANLQRDCLEVEIHLRRIPRNTFSAIILDGKVGPEVRLRSEGATMKGAAGKFREAYNRAQTKGLLK